MSKHQSQYEFQRHLAIIIGINDYINGVRPLETAVPDAEEIARILQDQYQYEVHLLVNQDARLEKLKDLIECFKNKTIPVGKEGEIKEVNKDDRILIYFAGHGIAHDAKEKQEGPVGYLIPQDATENIDTYLKMQDFHDALLKLPCRHLLVILDCCFSGAFYWSSINRDIVPKVKVYKQVYDHYIKYRAWQVITSTSDKQTAVDSSSRSKVSVDSKHSPFAKHLFDALNKGADLDNDGIITANDLFNFLRKKVAIETEEYKAQTPGICPLKLHDNGEYLFLWREPDLQDAPKLDSDKSPYRGLKSYEAEHKDLYFGRKEQIEQLYKTVNNSEQRALTVVLGASGTGKSSLVKAGLIPFLEKQKLEANPSLQKWKILKPIRLGESPLTELTNSISEDLKFTNPQPDSDPSQTNEPNWFSSILNFFGFTNQPNKVKQNQQLEREVKLLSKNLENWFKNNPNRTLLLTIDQFEELITLQPRQEQKEQKQKKKEEKEKEKTQQELVLKWLPKVISKYGERLRIVLTLRSDFESQFQDGTLKKYWTEEARFHIKEMTTAELREAITEPASKNSIFFVPNTLVDKLIDEVAGMPGTLPLLSFTLNELYSIFVEDINNGEKDDRAITEEYYNKLGGVGRSLTKKAEEVYENLVNSDKAYEQTIRRVMLRMVAIGGGELARRRVLESELKYPEPEKTRVKEVVKAFSEPWLLVGGTNTEKKSYVEPAHDALVRGWDRLLNWEKDEEENLILQRQLTPAAVEWKDGQLQSKGYLWHNNPRLDSLKEKLKSDQNWFNELEAEFIDRSVKRKTFNTRLSWGVAFSVMLGLSVLTVAVYIRGERSKLQATAANVKNLTSVKPLDALSEIVEATDNPFSQSVVQVRSSLLSAVQTPKERNRLRLPDDSQSCKSEVRTFLGNAVDTRKINIICSPKWLEDWNELSNNSSNPDCDFIVDVSRDNDLNLLLQDLNGNQIGDPFQGHEDVVTSVAISPDCKFIVSGSRDNSLRLWDKDGNQIGEPLQGHESWVRWVAVSPDSRSVISLSNDRTIRLWDVNQENVIYFFSEKGKRKGGVGEKAKVALSKDGKVILANNPDSKSPDPGTTYPSIPEPGTSDLDYQEYNANNPYPKSPEPGTTYPSIPVPGTSDLDYQEYNANNPYPKSPEPGTTYPSIPVPGTSDLDYQEYNEPVTLDDGTIIVNIGAEEKIAIADDGEMSVSGDEDGKIILWDRDKSIDEDSLGNSILAIAIAPDGTSVVGSTYNGIVQLWNIKDQKLIPQNLETEKCEKPVYTIAFSPRGNYIAGTNSTSVCIWDRNSGDFIRTYETKHSMQIESIAFSHNEELIATGSRDNTVQLYDTKTHQLIGEPFQGHKGWVSAIAFSPDDEFIATGSWDKTVRLWDVNGNQMGSPFKGHTQWISSIRFSSDGQSIISGSAYDSVRWWQAGKPEDWLERACSQLRKHSLLPKDRNINICDGISSEKSEENPISSEKFGKISSGETILVPTLINPDKQAGVDAIADGNFEQAISSLTSYLNPEKNPNDPEAQIYLNNAKIANQKSHTIAVSVPITGDVNASLEILRGVAQAQDEYNNWAKTQQGIVPIRVLIADDSNDPKNAKKIATHLAQETDVLGVVGHYASGVTREAAKAYNQEKLVAISPVSTSVKLSNVLGQYVFRTVPNDKVAAEKLANYTLNSLKKQKAILVYNSQSEYSCSLASEFITAFSSQEGEQLNQDCSQHEISSVISQGEGQVLKEVNLSDPNFDATESLQGIDENTVLVLLGDTSTLDQSFAILSANNGKLPVLGGDDLYGPKVLEFLAKDKIQNQQNIVVAIPWHIKSDRQSDFLTKSQKLWGYRDVNWRTVTSYDAAKALIAAIKQNPNREEVAKILRLDSFTAQGATEQVQFSSGERNGDIIELVKIVKSDSSSRSGYDYEFKPVENNSTSQPET